MGEINRNLEKSYCPHFDTFPRRRIRRRGGIVEGAVRRPAGAAVFYRIEGLKYHRLVALHVGEVVPAVLGIEHGMVNFAAAVRVDARAGNQLLRPYAARVSDPAARAAPVY